MVLFNLADWFFSRFLFSSSKEVDSGSGSAIPRAGYIRAAA
jgi:hypothetical protein